MEAAGKLLAGAVQQAQRLVNSVRILAQLVWKLPEATAWRDRQQYLLRLLLALTSSRESRKPRFPSAASGDAAVPRQISLLHFGAVGSCYSFPEGSGSTSRLEQAGFHRVSGLFSSGGCLQQQRRVSTGEARRSGSSAAAK